MQARKATHGLDGQHQDVDRTHHGRVYQNDRGTHTHPFNSPFSGTTWVSRYQKGKTNLNFTEARDSDWQWHQLGHMQVCTSLQTDNHASTPPLSFLQAGCPSCHPTNSVKAQKGKEDRGKINNKSKNPNNHTTARNPLHDSENIKWTGWHVKTTLVQKEQQQQMYTQTPLYFSHL